jgi:chromosome segregation ATPase
MSISVNLVRMLNAVDPSIREVLYAILEEIEKQQKERVTKEEFNELREIIADLSRSVRGLAEAQSRTEARLSELTEAQSRTEARLSELAEAQSRTEARVEELAASQKELAEAQRKTEEEIRKLIKGFRSVRMEVGGLSRSVAYALENEAYRHLPGFLRERYGLEVKDRIIRAEIQGEEINLFARIKRNGQEGFLVGESVLRLDDRSKLKQVWKKVEAVKESQGGEVTPIIVTHFATRDMLERAEKAGFIVVQSFEW